MPTRINQSKQAIKVEEARRKALVAAIIFQVHLAYAGYETAYKSLVEEQRIFNVSKQEYMRKKAMQETGLISKMEEFIDKTNFELSKINVNRTLVDAMISQANLRHNIGHDLNENLNGDFYKKTNTPQKKEGST